MKKKSLALLVAAMCITLSACGEAETDSTSQENTDDVSLESIGDTVLENLDSVLIESTFYEIDGTVMCINRDKFGSLIMDYIEPTTENWREYLEIYSYDQEYIQYDAFGEITNTTTSTNYCIRPILEEGYYYVFNDFVIEFKNKETGALYTSSGYSLDCNDYNYYIAWADFNYDDYECTRIKGCFYLVDLPEQAIYTIPNDYDNGTKTVFFVGDKGYCSDYRLNPYTRQMTNISTSDWQEKYMNN